MSEKRVLVIDDEAEIRRNLMFGLTQEGFECTTCPDGISAVHELEKCRGKGVSYNYIVTDIFMPDIDGLKILKVIKREFPNLPVVVITGFGDAGLRDRALAEQNTGYLDKPFEIPDLVAALDRLEPGDTAAGAAADPETEKAVGGESISAYFTIRITEPQRAQQIFNRLYFMEGIEHCDAVRGDLDIVVLGQASSEEGLAGLRAKVEEVDGVEIISVSPVERPKLDRDVERFIDEYQKAMETKPDSQGAKGPASYLFIDVDPEYIQQVFTTVFFVDDVVMCDVTDEGRRLVGMVRGGGSQETTLKVIEKLSQVEGVLRVREAKIVTMLDM